MNNVQLTNELNDILSLLNKQLGEINAINEKFRVALTGVLRLVGEGTPTLTNLHGNTEDLKGYLIKLNADVFETTTKSYEALRIKIEEVLKLISSSDRKS